MKRAADSSVMGVQLVTDQEDWRVGYDERISKYFCDTESDDIDDVCYSNVTRDLCFPGILEIVEGCSWLGRSIEAVGP